eukprot:684107-Hanusia_phi.AAC.1
MAGGEDLDGSRAEGIQLQSPAIGVSVEVDKYVRLQNRMRVDRLKSLGEGGERREEKRVEEVVGWRKGGLWGEKRKVDLVSVDFL